MSYRHASLVRHFISSDEDSLVGSLINAVASTGISSHRNTQIDAWRSEIRLLKEQLASSQFQDWFIVLEYEIPRRSRRPDVVLLSDTTIFVIEFKVGSPEFDSASRWQTNSYARDLRDFHEMSDGRRIVPILCATEAHITSAPDPAESSPTGVCDLVRVNAANLGVFLLRWNMHIQKSNAKVIDPELWLNSPYRPTPTIIEAATLLYEGHGVRELSHRYAHNLDKTTEMLLSEVSEARAQSKRVICFVTGVPGAGKTLTGLNVVHSPNLTNPRDPSGIFLSGNGPLVKVVREALVKNQVSKGRKSGESRHEATTFIQNVHNFLRFHIDRPFERPYENVVVFDEAQRAWDAQQMNRKRDVPASEASLLLEVMERLPDWAVIVALVGGGQEIFVGEAGLEEWGRALRDRSVPWRVVASPEVLKGGDSVAGHKLFLEGIPDNIDFVENELSHLDVVVRSHRAQRWAEWVNEFLLLRIDGAKAVFPESQEFPCYVTRNMSNARNWLRMHLDLDKQDRIGLVATSDDQRLRAYGLERSSAFRLNYPFEKWFLEQDSDVRSSHSLEVAASEFECQGLELDWVGICWGGDLTPSLSLGEWDYRKFRGANWQNINSESERIYARNRYRVLLTRARKGLVIWIPEGDLSDKTRDPARFDRVFTALREAGVPLLEEEFGHALLESSQEVLQENL